MKSNVYKRYYVSLNNEVLTSIREAARLIGIPKSTLYDRVIAHDYDFKGVIKGKKVRICESLKLHGL